ncbi:MAG TPA: sulfatase-like hydrolase/transferase [Sedimentisphaerales bacterium]|nr:sulfatase-like hydrolase/transferase [Sedimentisphaerales bacterium]
MMVSYTRRDFLKAIGAGAAAVTLHGCMGPSTGPTGKKRRPNIVFIMADDLGYGDLGCYGQKLTKTPRVDQMAAEGMRFTQCYAGACVCAPSRSVLMTGQHTGHTRVRENSCRTGGVRDEITGGGCRLPLMDEDVTVAEVLKQAGYATGITGKWGLGDPGTTGVPNKQGFDEWFGYLNQNHAVFYYTDYLWHNEEKVTLEGNKNGRQQQYTHDLFTDFAVDFIRRHRGRPFFLYVAYTSPHFNMEVPSTEPYTDKPWPEKAKIFAAMVTRMDRDVGRILDLLSALGIDDNTIVFFCSDNGAAGSGGPMFNSSGPLKGGKGGFHEGGIRTPMVVRWPGKVPAGKVSDAPWYYADVMPTLAELAGAKPPVNIDGISVLPALLGRKQQNLSDRFMYWESPPPKLHQVVRWRNWKARRPKPDQPLELYNLAEDLREEHNVADRYPDVIDVFEEYLKTARTESPNWPMEGRKQ